MKEPFNPNQTKQHRRRPEQPRHDEAGSRHGPQGGPHGPHDRRGPHGGGRHGGHRVRRGETRFLFLDALRDGPKHGYEIIKVLEERSNGDYVPSPGSVYPTLQLLEELGFVKADQESERRTYQLTKTGLAELDAHVEEVKVFWLQFKKPVTSAAGKVEIGFLQDDLAHLNQTVWNGLQDALERDDKDMIRRVRQAVERCRDEVRGIVSGVTTK